MTNQIQGEILYEGWPGGSDDAEWAQTPWMPVRGDIATFGVEVIFISGLTLKWKVQTRTLEDPTPAASPLVSQTGITAPGTYYEFNTDPALQMVRYCFATGGSASVAASVLIRALGPSWQVDR